MSGESFSEERLVRKMACIGFPIGCIHIGQYRCMRCMSNSLVICLFARNVYDLPTTVKALNSIGIEITEQELTDMARRIYRQKVEIKSKMGFDFHTLRFPKRFFETPGLHGKMEEEVMQDLLNRYNNQGGTAAKRIKTNLQQYSLS